VLAAVTPGPPVARERTSPVLIVAVVLTGLLALGVVGYALSRGSPNPPGAASATNPALPTATPTDSTGATDEPIASLPAPGGGLNGTAALGEKVDLQNTSSGVDLGTVEVIKSKKYTSYNYSTADKGKTYVGVDVRYDAVSGFDYSPLDWVAHDSSGAQYTWDGTDLNPSLDSGTLAAGRHREGWTSFQVPKSTAHLWIDYENSNGTVVFTVKLY
jgi:hypothetical protein